MLISSWNVNSVRARIENIKEYLKKFSPDIMMMQEIKTPDDTYPYEDIKKLKYENYVFGQKSYNGVAIVSKKKLNNIHTPNGNPVDTEKYSYKLYWLDSLIKKLKSLSKQNENIIIGGDFNIIPSAEDVHNPKSYENDALFRLEIRKKLRELINLGFHDAYRFIHPEKEGYTFWDYTSGAWQKNNGMRIDHFLVSSSLIGIVKDVKINKFPRGRQKPSDHTPIEIELA